MEPWVGDFETTERSLLPAAETLARTAFPMHLRPLLARAARIDPRLPRHAGNDCTGGPHR